MILFERNEDYTVLGLIAILFDSLLTTLHIITLDGLGINRIHLSTIHNLTVNDEKRFHNCSVAFLNINLDDCTVLPA